ncbi:MAG: Phosphoglucomutase-2 [Marteilia pararefringens]
MITASHNSKEYNGYKVYDWRGCFIKEPNDALLLNHIRSYLEESAREEDVNRTAEIFKSFHKYSSKSGDTNQKENWEETSFHDPYDEILELFTQSILKSCGGCLEDDSGKANDQQQQAVGIVYSAMHGCGELFVRRIFAQRQFSLFESVGEQAEPDELFRTVRDPNPEVGAETLKMACELAERLEYPIVFVNDPDADRLAMCERIEGKWKFFTGNEMAMIYLAARIETMFTTSSGVGDPKCLDDDSNSNISNIFYSTVSTMFPKTICQFLNIEHRVKVSETLTGFKYLGEKVLEAQLRGERTLLAFEESLGFLVSDHVYDKDGVSACLAFAELANTIYTRASTFNAYLTQLQEKYGYHLTFNKYYKVQDMSKVIPLMDRIRDWRNRELSNDSTRSLEDYPAYLGSISSSPSPPSSDDQYKVTGVRDLTVGFDSNYEDNKPRLPISENNQMITFYCGSKFVLTIRASGTEPKLKFYLEKVLPGTIFTDGTFASYESAIGVLRDEALDIMDGLLEPKKNQLLPGF